MTGPDRGVGLDLFDVSVRYGDRVVVDGITLSVPAGSWLGLIGPNGAGKSSLLRAVAGLVEASGRIEPADLGDRSRARTVAYLPQSPVLPPSMTVAEYVLLGRTAHLSWFAAESRRDRRCVIDALERLGLGPFAGRRLTELSGGEAQQVALARALAQDAPVLLLDEPTSALDLGHQMSVLERIEELRTERTLTVLSAMHDLTAAGRFADRLALLGEGRLLATGTAAEVLTAERLSDAFGAPVLTLDAPDGSRVVVPARSAATINP